MRKIINCLVLLILFFGVCTCSFANNSANLPQWEKNMKENNAKLRANLLQQLETLKQKELGFYDTYVRNCTPATLTTLGTAKVSGMKDGMCEYSKTVGSKMTMSCKIPTEELSGFVDESIKMINAGKESAKFDEIIAKYCVEQ